jgi:hypothetical protein
MPDEYTADEPKVDDHPDDLADTTSEAGEHAAPDGAPLHPLIDLSRDPTPGKPDHARPDDE